MPPFLFHVKHFDKCFMWIFFSRGTSQVCHNCPTGIILYRENFQHEINSVEERVI